MSDEAERQPFTIKLGGKAYELDPPNTGQVREIARAMDYSLARAGSTEGALEAYCMMVRAALRMKRPDMATPEAFDALPITQGELQAAARAVLTAAGFQVAPDPDAAEAPGTEKKS